MASALDDLTSSDFYWNQSAHFRSHEDVMKDRVPTCALRNAILRNRHLFKDKVVLEVGAGTGLFSMFAAKAGAKQVFAIENSPMGYLTKEIVQKNGLDKVVTVVQEKCIDDVKLPVDKVDIIISDWVGYCVVQDSKISAVLKARDKWLADDGLMFPDRVHLYVCGMEDAQYRADKIDWWEDVYGYDMSNISDIALGEPVVDSVQSDNVVTGDFLVQTYDLRNMKVEDFSWESAFSLTANRRDTCHALLFWMSIEFSMCHSPIYVNAGPEGQWTRWKQTIFYLDESVALQKDEALTGVVQFKALGANLAEHAVTVRLTGGPSNTKKELVQEFRLRSWDTKEK